MSFHEMDDSQLYSDDYVNSTYQGEKFRNTFERIIALPPAQSDNAARCGRIVEFANRYLERDETRRPRTILDVGSGLCVFLHRMKQLGWRGTALDPDARAIDHARSVVGVNAVHGDFFAVEDLPTYQVVTFNKVLEHVLDPAAMLRKSRQMLAPGGFVYVELPDGERAIEEGGGREEFFIEHLHIFSFASLAALVRQAGFHVIEQERLREPSGKYTLRAFCAADNREPITQQKQSARSVSEG
jgi:SAM-dependent methyltransferase